MKFPNTSILKGNTYAQKDPHLREMEREAYEKGNLIFRDFEDLIKTGKIDVEIDFSETGEPKMSLKEWKNNEINTKLMKKWGLLSEAAKPDFLDLDKDGDKEEPMKDAAKDAKEKDLDEAQLSEEEIEETVEETTAPKMISVHEAKQITRRILERVRKESK